MKIRDVAAWSCLTAVMAFGVAACGDDDDSGGGGGGSGELRRAASLTVYSSLPLQGASRPQSEDVIKGIKLALKQKGNKCGDFTIKYESLDDATAAAGKWEPGATSANARKVAQDDSAIAYIGEFNSGASAISIPITNEAGHPAGQPVQHRARPDQGRSAAPSRASRTSTTRPASATTGASCRSTPSRVPRRRST